MTSDTGPWKDLPNGADNGTYRLHIDPSAIQSVAQLWVNDSFYIATINTCVADVVRAIKDEQG